MRRLVSSVEMTRIVEAGYEYGSWLGVLGLRTSMEASWECR